MSKNRHVSRKRFCKLMMGQGEPARAAKEAARVWVEFEQYKEKKIREVQDVEQRKKATAIFGRLCWKDAWEELRE